MVLFKTKVVVIARQKTQVGEFLVKSLCSFSIFNHCVLNCQQFSSSAGGSKE